VAIVVDDPDEKPSGTAALPVSPASAVMFLYGLELEAPEAMVVAVVRLKLSSKVEPPNVQLVLVLGVVPKPLGNVPI
jgi:hypothetical protein